MKLRLGWRLARVFAHLVYGLAICGLVFPWRGREQRLAHVRKWSAQLLRIFGVTVELHPDVVAPAGGLWVANHVSWIDVFVINAVLPSRFVAKSEVRSWPLVGKLSAWAGTIFVARASRRDLRRTIDTLVSTLQAGERVVVFPEGTSAAQGAILPFRANLFEAAIEAGVAVHPLALSYRDDAGHLHGAVEYIGDTSLVESMVAMLSRQPIRARLEPLAPLSVTSADRRELARRSHMLVEASLRRSAPS
jgi:1-acyl-sn-glycerol-3-phosphate acyltransferase